MGMESPATRRLLVLVPLLALWSSAVAVASPSAAAVAPPVRVGVVLDLTSDVGRESLACISMALEDFDAAHATSGDAPRVDLRVRDSRGDLATAAEELIKSGQVQAIIWAPRTLTKANQVAHLGHRSNHVRVLSFSGISPTSCAFWLEDPVAASGGHAKFGFTLGSENITFTNPKIGRRVGRKLDTSKSRKNCRGSKTGLKIAVPLKLGFRDFVNVTKPNSAKQDVTGYSIDVFKAAMRKLHPSPCYTFFASNGTYDELVRSVSSGMYDGAVGDVTITADRLINTDFTMPYTQSGVSMLVLAENEPFTIRWTFTKPLNAKLWFASIAFFLYTGFVLWMIELPKNLEYQGSSLRQCSTALYFVFSTLTFSHGHTIRSPLSKIVVVIWCFVVLVLVQSYTANLSSILTAKRLRPRVTDFTQLQQSDDFVGYQDDSFVRSFLLNHNISENRLRNYTTKEEYAAALKKGTENKGVSAIVDEIPYLTSFLSDPRYRNDFRMMHGCIYKTPGFGFAFRLGSPLVHNLSTAILNLTVGDEGSRIEMIGAGTEPDTDFQPLTIESFSGLFIITGSISTLMLLISIMRLIYAKCTELRKADVHMIGENVGDTLPDPVQQNGMHGGPLPAGHIQIEMRNV
ncbi:Glutamate receptor 2.5 [Hordeum vulgare]|nr:Glutamate receptor 2.5 [Hordeum vulgare]